MGGWSTRNLNKARRQRGHPSSQALTGLLHVLLHRRPCHIARKKANWPESKMLSRSFPHPIIGKNFWQKMSTASQGGIIPEMLTGVVRASKFSGQWLSCGILRWVNGSTFIRVHWCLPRDIGRKGQPMSYLLVVPPSESHRKSLWSHEPDSVAVIS